MEFDGVDLARRRVRISDTPEAALGQIPVFEGISEILEGLLGLADGLCGFDVHEIIILITKMKKYFIITLLALAVHVAQC